jgi:EpsI family protein
VLSAIPVAVIANGLRLLGTGLAVQHYGPEAAEGFFHTFSGWIIFLLALLMFFLIQQLIVWIAPPMRQPTAENTPISANSVRDSIFARMAILTFSLVIGTVYLGYASKTEAVPIREPLSRIPMEIGHWQGRPNLPISDKVLAVLQVSEYLSRSYANSGPRPVDLYIGYYQSQRMGETIHSPKNCLPGGGWMPINSEQIEIPVGGKVILVNEYLIQKGTEKALVLYWYHNAGRVIASEYLAKFYLVLDAVYKNRTDGALVRVVAPISKSADESKRDAVDFVKSLFPLLSRHLPA